MIEPAGGPQLSEILREQIKSDKSDNQNTRPGDNSLRLPAAVHHAPHQNHDADGLEGGDEEQRDPGDARPRELRAVHGSERRQQPGPRGELADGVTLGAQPARARPGAALKDFSGYDTHGARLLS